MSLREFFAVFATAFFVSPLSAEVISNTWSAVLEPPTTTAIGDLNGISISATTTSTAPFTGLIQERFSGTAWQTDNPLEGAVSGLIASDVNAGDQQIFTMSSPLETGLLYIENFDSLSVANITLTGDSPQLSLLSGSVSISYTPLTDNSGTLASTNALADGEGDAILQLGGNIDSITLDYTNGEGANGVFYAFALDTASVPEPTSILLAAILPAALLIKRKRR